MDEITSQVECESLTFVIFTYNEERRLPFVLRNFVGVGRILVVDCHSTDKTRDIARAHGCDILMRDLSRDVGFVEEPFIVSQIWASVKTEWIYWGFADELADQSTLDAIVGAVQSSRYQIVNIARKNHYYGTFIDRAFVHRMNRIFKKDAIDFNGNKIHGFGRVTVPESEICYLDAKKYFVHHLIANDANTYVRSMNTYTGVDAASYEGSLSGFVLGLKMLKFFTAEYIFHGAFRNGFAGLSLVILHLFYKFLVMTKAFENVHHLNNGGIETENDKTRNAILNTMRIQSKIANVG